jgi:CHAD domain-containing protein
LGSSPIPAPAAPGSRPRKRKRSFRGGSLRLRRNVALRESLLSAFAGAMRSARRFALAATEDPKTAVHEFRKAIRRARSVVRLLRPSLGRRAAAGLVHELRHALAETSSLRDDDVLVATVAGVAGDDPELFVEAAELAARVGSAERPVPADVLKGALPILRRLPPALEVVLPREYSTPDLERGLARTYRRVQRTLEHAIRTRADADFHQWRKRVKELRYQLELLASIASPPLKAREKALSALARELGEVTDLAVMCSRLRAEGGSRQGRLIEKGQALLRTRADTLLERGQAAFAQAPGDFALQVLAERG